MNKLSLFGKLLFFVNIVFALVTIISFVVPYVPVTILPTLSTISLVVPFLVIINIVFVFIWSWWKKVHFLLSMTLLILWYFILGPLYSFSGGGDEKSLNSFSVMSFNARNFNINGQLDIRNVDSLIIDFVENKNPDIVCFQECHFAMKRSSNLGNYKYKFVDFIYGKHSGRVIQAIYSKYPIVKVDSIQFPASANSAIYADILLKKDTVRLYNVHLQSFKIVPDIQTIREEESSKLFARSRRVMLKQYEQAQLIREHMDNTPYKKIVAGDFNNTQYSNIYQTVKGDLNDTFEERGKGFGRTYNLFGFPMRIDYIFSDSSFEVLSHENFDDKLSDHYPLMATFGLTPH